MVKGNMGIYCNAFFFDKKLFVEISGGRSFDIL